MVLASILTVVQSWAINVSTHEAIGIGQPMELQMLHIKAVSNAEEVKSGLLCLELLDIHCYLFGRVEMP